MPPSIPAPVPIVIGVTGHKDLRAEDRSALEERVREFLRDLQERFPTTPLVLLSSLAEGADRLVARTALEAGCRLIVPLPMERDDYVTDFPHTVADFDELLERAEKVFTLASSEPQDRILSDQERREHCYALAGAYIARHSQILLALWDGRDNQAIGGTAHVVRFKREGVEPPFGPPRNPLDHIEGGAVYHIATPRQSVPEPIAQPLTLVKRFPIDHPLEPDEADAAHHDVLAWIERFNRDALGLSAEQIQASLDDVVQPAQLAAWPGAVQSPLSLYAMADALSLRNARRMLWTLRSLLVLAFAAAVVSQIYTYLPTKPTELLIAYLTLAYAVCPAVYVWARYVGDYQNRYLDYRALAEGLRVLAFWRLAGLKIQVADHYLRKQRSEMDWIRQAIRIATIPTRQQSATTAAPASDAVRVRAVLTHWIEDQATFFGDHSRSDHARATRYGYLGMALFLLGIVLPLGKLFTETANLLIVAMSVTVVLAALVHLYSRVLGFAEHANQYERMYRIFSKGAAHVRESLEAGKLAEAQDAILELGRESLIENGEWLLFHRRLPVQVPGTPGGD